MIAVSGLEAKPYNVTHEGIRELREQLQALKHRRRVIAQEMREITSQTTDLGVLEDSTFTLNQNQATEIDGQIDLLERIIGLAQIIKKPAATDRVQLGSQVTIKLDGEERTYTIVGSVEADPLEGKVSDASPLGQSMLGKRVNDQFELVSPTGQRIPATIIRIE